MVWINSAHWGRKDTHEKGLAGLLQKVARMVRSMLKQRGAFWGVVMGTNKFRQLLF